MIVRTSPYVEHNHFFVERGWNACYARDCKITERQLEYGSCENIVGVKHSAMRYRIRLAVLTGVNNFQHDFFPSGLHLLQRARCREIYYAMLLSVYQRIIE